MTFQSISVPNDKVTNGRVLVPIRAVSEYMNGIVNWNKTDNTIKISKNEREVKLQINSKSAQINGEFYTLDVPAKVERGVTYVPIRFVGEALGLSVEWLPRERLAILVDYELQKRIDVIVEPPLSLEDAVAIMNKVSIAYDLSGIKQKQQHLRPYFTERMIQEILSSGGLKQFPDNLKLPFISFASDKNPSYLYGNDQMMFISRSVMVEQAGVYASENGTLVKTSKGWRVEVVRWEFDYPH
ncbi:hypothetical protein BK133_01645 [Paenibacillus sp. FSL H8-0548]|nr:hypothetical protein BK133_01645 [Paenibacillus sp. FSL H8-0548]